MNENKLENIVSPEKPEKEKREMSEAEVEEMGQEIEEYLEGLKARAKEIRKELENSPDDEQLREELGMIEDQLDEDQEGLEGFIEDIKTGDYSDAKIEK